MRFQPVIPETKHRRGTALRVAIIGGVGLFLFAVLFFRLWSLQVVTGDEYLAEATQNRTREVRVRPPRGQILDRDGNVLVDNRTSMALQLDPIEVPDPSPARRKLFLSIADLLHRDLKWVQNRYREETAPDNPPGSPVTLADNVDDDLVFYLQEHQAQYPEIQVNRVFVRKYPQGVEAAHLLGSVGEVTAEDLDKTDEPDIEGGDSLGKAGIEQTYDQTLRGSAGTTKFQVDSTGKVKGQLDSQTPHPGDSLRLTIDQTVQQAGEAALGSIGLPGAFVAMDVNNGEVLGLGSAPTFDPSEFTRPLSQKRVDELYDEDNGAPLFNRAITGAYPVGSIYKPITALAALDAGEISPSDVVNDTGTVKIADQEFDNAGKEAHGPVDLRRSLQVSSDVYYYLLGAKMNGTNQLQDWSKSFGIGETTGIDLPGESAGFLPSKAAINKRDREEPNNPFAVPWVIGDNIQLAIGQGSLQADPLQMAVAYGALGNGGTVYKPRLVKQTEDAAGRVLTETEPEAVREIPIDPGNRDIIMSGLHDAAQTPEGTSYKVFGGFPIPVAGKTGTAERPPNGDQAWYAVLAPYPDPKIVVTTTVEEGGFGADTAAPVALQILSAYFDKQAKAVSGGTGAVE